MRIHAQHVTEIIKWNTRFSRALCRIVPIPWLVPLGHPRASCDSGTSGKKNVFRGEKVTPENCSPNVDATTPPTRPPEDDALARKINFPDTDTSDIGSNRGTLGRERIWGFSISNLSNGRVRKGLGNVGVKGRIEFPSSDILSLARVYVSGVKCEIYVSLPSSGHFRTMVVDGCEGMPMREHSQMRVKITGKRQNVYLFFCLESNCSVCWKGFKAGT